MGRDGKWMWSIALSVGLGLTAGARADDDDTKPAKTGNWFTRLFVHDPASKKKDGAKKDEAALTPGQARQKAYLEWQRRLEVCDKLKQIAFETRDMDLDRKADALDQRAWDIYVQRTGGPKSNLSPDEQFLEGRLGVEAAQGPRGADMAGSTASATIDARTAGRRE